MKKHYDKINKIVDAYVDPLVDVKRVELGINNYKLKMYHEMGKSLMETEEGMGFEFADNHMRKYAKFLTEECNIKYSYNDLWSMKQLYLKFPNLNIMHALFRWEHFKEILQIENESEMKFYLYSIIENNFTVEELKDYIKSNAYEKSIKEAKV